MSEIRTLVEDCLFRPLSVESQEYINNFHCGNDDLDDFFHYDAPLYASELMGKSYCFVSSQEDVTKIVGAFTVANDSIKVYDLPKTSQNRLQRKIPNAKRMRSYPAVLIGRLGINSCFQGKGLHLGDQLLDFIKRWFLHPENKTGCRYIVVDAYNTPKIITFYIRNGFSFLYDNEAEEKSVFKISTNSLLRTRLMVFDLMPLLAKIIETAEKPEVEVKAIE